MKCLDCTSEVYLCNQCTPKPQRKTKLGLEVDIHSLSIFRIARHEAIFIKSEDLATLSEHILGTLLMSNVVITDKNANLPLLVTFEKLAEKILQDKRWKDCATVRFIVVDETAFNSAKKFLAGEKMPPTPTRGTLLTQICNKVDVAQKRIKNPEQAMDFVTKFLKDGAQNYNEFLHSTVPIILKDQIASEFLTEEVKEREREEKKMMEQL